MDVGEYEIVKQIGEGSFGRTFLGRHKILKSVQVCIKQEKTGKDPYIGLFREEAEILAKLHHPSLPSFMGYMEMGGSLGQVLLLSYVDGKPLDKLLTKHGPVDDEHLCWIIDRIFGALSYLHGRWNIVHCDLKPGNVILDIPDHNATLVDLGMASANPVEWTKAKGGTPGFLPPEFSVGLPPIPASDIFSAGKIALVLAGGDPIKGDFPADMAPLLRAFFEPMIRHDPRERPQSVDPLRSELARIRHKVFGRSTCAEQFKYRNGKLQ